MDITRLELKEEALKRMQMLNLSSDTIRVFNESQLARVSMDGNLLFPSVIHKSQMWKFEEEMGGMVYHMIYNCTGFVHFLTLLYVSKYPNEWVQDRADLEHGFPLAYVINENDERLSEFGFVGVKSFNGAVIRTE